MLIHRIAHPLVTVKESGRTVGPYNAARIYTEQMGQSEDALYQALYIVSQACSALSYTHTPPPFEDGFYMRPTEQSVFTSVEQAREWFRSGVSLMHDAGFLWFTYEVAERYVKVGTRQAAADLRRARLVSMQPIPLTDDPDYGVFCNECCDWDCRCCESCGLNYCDCDTCTICWLNLFYCECPSVPSTEPADCAGCGQQPWSCRC